VVWLRPQIFYNYSPNCAVVSRDLHQNKVFYDSLFRVIPYWGMRFIG
jgi:hypothetical protein